MSTVPSKLPQQVAWYQTRQTPWTTSATDIGISTGEMTTLSGYISAAADALSAYNTARAASEAATTTLHDACNVMHGFGATLLAKIKAKAAQVGGDSVYATAMIPPPATPTPVGELTKPSEFSVTLDETGALNLAWKCTQPAAPPAWCIRSGGASVTAARSPASAATGAEEVHGRRRCPRVRIGVTYRSRRCARRRRCVGAVQCQLRRQRWNDDGDGDGNAADEDRGVMTMTRRRGDWGATRRQGDWATGLSVAKSPSRQVSSSPSRQVGSSMPFH
jgi:hypothetical protein